MPDLRSSDSTPQLVRGTSCIPDGAGLEGRDARVSWSCLRCHTTVEVTLGRVRSSRSFVCALHASLCSGQAASWQSLPQ
jgi:hypothetical protein